MFCGKCGEQVNEGAAFCAHCGAEVESTVLPQQPGTAEPKPGLPETPAAAAVSPLAAAELSRPEDSRNVKIMVTLIISAAVAASILLGVCIGIKGSTATDSHKMDAKRAFSKTFDKDTALKEANSNAALAYDAVANYIADQESVGIPADDTLNSIMGMYDLSNRDYAGFGMYLCNEMREHNVEDGYVYVMRADVTDYTDFAVQWSDDGKDGSEGGIIGQHPHAVFREFAEDVDFGSYYGEAELERDRREDHDLF